MSGVKSAVLTAVTPGGGVDFGPAITQASDSTIGLMQDNVLLLLALPVAWAGYKIVKKIIARFS